MGPVAADVVKCEYSRDGFKPKAVAESSSVTRIASTGYWSYKR
jgi:hypothetical protein